MKNKLALLGGLLCTLALVFTFCKNPAKEPVVDEKPAQTVKVPAFNRDSAFQYVVKQTEFGPRVPNTAAHQACKAWISSQLKTFGMEVIEQNFQAKAYTGTTLNGTNIIGQYKPELSRRILLAAHWDSRPFADSPLFKGDKTQPVMGADDGGSGVGVLLEIARQLQANPVEIGVDIVFFDAEDYGDGSDNPKAHSWCLGAQHWSKNLHYKNKIRPEYGILLDMVGASSARFGFDAISYKQASDVLQKVWGLAKEMGYGQYFVEEITGEITDDHVYVNYIAGIKMIDIINKPKGSETGFVPHWHTDEDTIDKIDPYTLRAVGQVLLAVIYREFNGEL
ncbi:MAG TPA: M28 family peptidase [Haliscomenobacter sp.]|nr:M28 family peptidase [Haliscomenobacter sp.]